MIINQTGGGKKPTGTKNITVNGVYDVTDFASADVQVPTTAPDNYLEFDIDANGSVTHSTTTSHLFDFSKIKILRNPYMFSYAYYQNANVSGKVDLSNLYDLVGSNYAFNYAFSRCTGLTSVDLSSLDKLANTQYAFSQAFYECTGLTSVDLSNLTTIESCNNCFSNAFYRCTGLTSVDLSNLTNIGNGTSYGGSYNFSEAFVSCTGLTSVDLSNLTMIVGSSACYRSFYGCSSLTNVRLPRLKVISESNCLSQMFNGCTSLQHIYFDTLYFTNNNLNACFYSMLPGVTGCTVHFPAEWETTMQTWSNVQNGFGGTNTTVLFDLPNSTVLDLSYLTVVNKGRDNFALLDTNNRFPNITSVDLSNLTTVSGTEKYYIENTFANLCYKNSYITSVNIGKLETIIKASSAFNFAFASCTGLTSVNLNNLTSILDSNNAMYGMFQGDTLLTNINLPSLRDLGDLALRRTFGGCTGLTSMSFPAIKNLNATGCFSEMFYGCAALTAIHFPSNMQSQVVSTVGSGQKWGASNATIYFDLPATNILTGANTVEYERNPKYDTAGALAWRVNGSSVTTTPYYTSGLTDPAISDTIYSDSACTQAVTTIYSIA